MDFRPAHSSEVLPLGRAPEDASRVVRAALESDLGTQALHARAFGIVDGHQRGHRLIEVVVDHQIVVELVLHKFSRRIL